MKINIFSACILVISVFMFFITGLAVGDKSDQSAGVMESVIDQNNPGTVEKQVPNQPKSGEEIHWQVISGGGTVDGSSTNFILGGTAGQTVIGTGTSDNFSMSHGFWQNFITGCCDTPGDANNDGNCNIGDAVYLGNYVFKPGVCVTNPPIGCPPECEAEGDANADGSINIGDQVYVNNYIFRPPPQSPYPECGPEK